MSLHLLVLVTLGAVVHHTEGFWGSPPLRDTGKVARIFTSFTGTDKLGTHTSSLSYVFIISRHGMVVPTKETYPTDWHYKDKWEKDRFTTHGKRMMTRLGRSLATRYKYYIQAATIQRVKVTTMNTDFGEQNAIELLDGLLPGLPKPPVKKTDMDKFILLKSPTECKAYDTLKDEAMKNEKHATGVPEFFEYLKRHIREPSNSASKWDINSHQKVYNLWEIMDFERKSKEWSPLWCGHESRVKMRNIVNQYLYDSIFKDKRMPKYIAGPLFKEIMDEVENKHIKMHIHITNDFTYAAFKSLLLGCGVRAPEFGETLMMEMDNTGATIVHMYKPYRRYRNYDLDLKFGDKQATRTFSTIVNKLQTQYYINNKLDEEAWKHICKGEHLLKPSPSGILNRERQALKSPIIDRSVSRGAPDPDYPRGGATTAFDASAASKKSETPLHSETIQTSHSKDLPPLPSAGSAPPLSPLTSGSGRHSETAVGYPMTSSVPTRSLSYDALPTAPALPKPDITASPLRDEKPPVVTVRHP